MFDTPMFVNVCLLLLTTCLLCFLSFQKAEFRRDPAARKARHLPEEELSWLHGESLLQWDQYYRPGQETQAPDPQRGECRLPSRMQLRCASQKESIRQNHTEAFYFRILYQYLKRNVWCFASMLIGFISNDRLFSVDLGPRSTCSTPRSSLQTTGFPLLKKCES